MSNFKLLNYPITNYKFSMTSSPRLRQPVAHRRNPEDGYILITLLLFVALLAIAAVALAPEIAFQVKRDREEELIHRGTQYSRAIKHYVKKFGRYPTRIEELENTNNLRFLRKRYKDPVSGKDFKILHMGEVHLSFGAGIAGANTINASPNASPGFPGTPGGMNQTQFVGGSLGNLTQGSMTTSMPASGPPGQQTQAGIGQNAPADGSDDESSPAGVPNTAAGQAASGVPAPGNQAQAGPGAGFGSQVFGGGPMVGVVSVSKDETIRVFNKKNHYYQWQFIYDPSTDRGGLLTTPNQPSLQGATVPQAPPAGGATPGVPGTAGAPGFTPQPGPQGVQPLQPSMPPDQNEGP